MTSREAEEEQQELEQLILYQNNISGKSIVDFTRLFYPEYTDHMQYLERRGFQENALLESLLIRINESFHTVDVIQRIKACKEFTSLSECDFTDLFSSMSSGGSFGITDSRQYVNSIFIESNAFQSDEIFNSDVNINQSSLKSPSSTDILDSILEGNVKHGYTDDQIEGGEFESDQLFGSNQDKSDSQVRTESTPDYFQLLSDSFVYDQEHDVTSCTIPISKSKVEPSSIGMYDYSSLDGIVDSSVFNQTETSESSFWTTSPWNTVTSGGSALTSVSSNMLQKRPPGVSTTKHIDDRNTGQIFESSTCTETSIGVTNYAPKIVDENTKIHLDRNITKRTVVAATPRESVGHNIISCTPTNTSPQKTLPDSQNQPTSTITDAGLNDDSLCGEMKVVPSLHPSSFDIDGHSNSKTTGSSISAMETTSKPIDTPPVQTEMNMTEKAHINYRQYIAPELRLTNIEKIASRSELFMLAVQRFYSETRHVIDWKKLIKTLIDSNILAAEHNSSNITPAQIRMLAACLTIDTLLAMVYFTYGIHVAQKLYFTYVSIQQSCSSILLVNRSDIKNKRVSVCFKEYKRRVHAQLYHDPFKELQLIGMKLLYAFESENDELKKQKCIDEFLALKAAQMDSLSNVTVSIDHEHEGFMEIKKYLNQSSSPALFQIILLGRQGDALSTTKDFEQCGNYMRQAYVFSDLAINCPEVADMFYRNVLFKLNEFEEQPSPLRRHAVFFECRRALWALEDERKDTQVFWKRMILLRMAFAYVGVGKQSKIVKNYYPSQKCLNCAERLLQHPDLKNMEIRREMFKACVTSKIQYERSRLSMIKCIEEAKKASDMCEKGNYTEQNALETFKDNALNLLFQF